MATHDKRVTTGVALAGLALGLWMGWAMVVVPEPTEYVPLEEIVTDASGLRGGV